MKKQEILRRIRRGESMDHYETVRRRKDGQLIDVSLTISPIKGPKGEIVGVSKIARDITKQKQTERRLAEQTRLLDLTNEAIIVRDIKAGSFIGTAAPKKCTATRPEEALGKITHKLLQRCIRKFTKVFEKIWRAIIDGRVNWFIPERTARKSSSSAVGRSTAIGKADRLRSLKQILRSPIESARNSEQAVNLAVTRILSESPALTDAVPRILQTVCETLGWEVGDFWTPEPDGRTLRCSKCGSAHAGRFPKFKARLPESHFAPGVGLPGRVWSSLKPAWISDVTKDDNFPRAPVAARRRSSWCLRVSDFLRKALPRSDGILQPRDPRAG